MFVALKSSKNVKTLEENSFILLWGSRAMAPKDARVLMPTPREHVRVHGRGIEAAKQRALK